MGDRDTMEKLKALVMLGLVICCGLSGYGLFCLLNELRLLL